MIIFRGEDPVLVFTLIVDGGLGFDLTGALLETRFMHKTDKQEVIIPNSSHVPDPDQVVNRGKLKINMVKEESDALKTGNTKFIIKVTVANKVTKFEGKVTVRPGNTVDK